FLIGQALIRKSFCFSHKMRDWLPFELGPGRTAPEKKSSDDGHSAAIEGVSRKYITHIHKHITEWVSQALRKIWKFATKKMGTPDVCTDSELSKAVWVRGVRNVLYHTCVQLPRKCNEGEDSANKSKTLVPFVPASTFQNLQTVNQEQN
uniref:Large ribosomal subunit protein eL31 n=1 Tax=Mustela putorius furo TaxID=9669 RepID=M3XTW3_MUSPF